MIAFVLFLEASEPSKNFYKSKLVYCLNIFTAVTLRVEPNFVVFLIEKERRRFCLNRFMPWKCEHSFTKKLTVITEPAVPVHFIAPLLILFSKLYSSKMQRMLNKDLTRFMQSFSRTPKSSKQKKGSAYRVHYSNPVCLTFT